jgi:hypothetical protein
VDGFIVISAEAGRALRSRHAPVRAGDVLARSGAFHAGSRVHVVVRGVDGGQNAIATGVIDCDAQALHPSPPVSARHHTHDESDPGQIVIQSRHVELLWPSHH